MKKFLIAIIATISVMSCISGKKDNSQVYGNYIVLPSPELNVELSAGDDIIVAIQKLKDVYNLKYRVDGGRVWSNDGKWDFREDTTIVSQSITFGGNDSFTDYSILFMSNSLQEIEDIRDSIITSYEHSEDFVWSHKASDTWYGENPTRYHGINYDIVIYDAYVIPQDELDYEAENGGGYSTFILKTGIDISLNIAVEIDLEYDRK